MSTIVPIREVRFTDPPTMVDESNPNVDVCRISAKELAAQAAAERASREQLRQARHNARKGSTQTRLAAVDMCALLASDQLLPPLYRAQWALAAAILRMSPHFVIGIADTEDMLCFRDNAGTVADAADEFYRALCSEAKQHASRIDEISFQHPVMGAIEEDILPTLARAAEHMHEGY